MTCLSVRYWMKCVFVYMCVSFWSSCLSPTSCERLLHELVYRMIFVLMLFPRVFGTSMVEEYEEIADPPERPDDQDDDLGNNLN